MNRKANSNCLVSSCELFCPVCEGARVGFYLELPDRFNPDGELYTLYRCEDCELVFLHPQYDESEAGRFYQCDGYDPFLGRREAQSLTQWIYSKVRPWAISWKVHLIERLLPQRGYILDIGAGTGAFLKKMKEIGWNAFGIERDPQAADYCRSELKLAVFTGDFADFENADNYYQVITFWHSLEHIHRLRENVAKLSGVLAPGGKVLIALPNYGSFDARIYGSNWVGYDAPRHLWHFNKPAITSLMHSYGFRLIKIIPMPLDPFYNCILSEGMIRDRMRNVRYLFRLPIVAMVSAIMGCLKPSLASSIIYHFEQI